MNGTIAGPAKDRRSSARGVKANGAMRPISEGGRGRTRSRASARNQHNAAITPVEPTDLD